MNIKTFKLKWLNSKEEEVRGVNITEAFKLAGYWQGDIKKLDYYYEITNKEESL